MVSILVYFLKPILIPSDESEQNMTNLKFQKHVQPSVAPAIGPMHSPPNMAIIRSKETCSAAEGPESSRVQRDTLESTGYQEATSAFAKILFSQDRMMLYINWKNKKRLMICHYSYVLWNLREQHRFSVHKIHFWRRSPRCRTWTVHEWQNQEWIGRHCR